MKYQTGLKRLWSAIVDSIVFLPFLLIEQWIYKKTNAVSMLFIWTTFIAFTPLFYSIILHFKYGQTIGKWVAGVKVVDISETRKLNLKQSIFRDIFYLIIQTIGLFYFLFLMFQTDRPEYLINYYKGFSEQPILWWTLIELITMLTNSKRRAIHDFFARSVVVRT